MIASIRGTVTSCLILTGFAACTSEPDAGAASAHCADRWDFDSAYELDVFTPKNTTRDSRGLPRPELGKVPIVAVDQLPSDAAPSGAFAQFWDSHPPMSVGTATITSFDGETITGTVTAGGDDGTRIVWLDGSFDVPICVD